MTKAHRKLFLKRFISGPQGPHELGPLKISVGINFVRFDYGHLIYPYPYPNFTDVITMIQAKVIEIGMLWHTVW